MSETTPPSSEKSTACSTKRLWILTLTSLVLNGLIVLFLFVGAVMHCHSNRERHERFAGRDGGGGGHFCDRGARMGGFDMRRDRDGFGPGNECDGHGFCPMRGGRGGFSRNEMGPGGPGPRPGPMMGMGGPGMPPPGPGFMGGPGMGMMAPDPAKMTDMVVDHLAAKLSLTDDQKAKVKPIVEAQMAQFRKDMEAQRAAFQKEIEDSKAKLKPILNADQQKQLDDIKLPGMKAPDAAKAEDTKPAAK